MFVRGEISITGYSPTNDTILDVFAFPNTITNTGLVQLANMIIGKDTDITPHIQIGNGGQELTGQYKTVTFDDETLFAFFADGAATSTWVDVVNGARIRFAHTFEVPTNIGINEVGLFDGPHDNLTTNMIAKQTFISTVQRILMRGATPTTDTLWLQIAWDITFGRHWEQIQFRPIIES